MKNLRAFWIVILLALTGCVFGDGGAYYIPTSTPDPLHSPVLKPTEEPQPQGDIYRGTPPPAPADRSAQSTVGDLDVNGDGRVNEVDVDVLAGQLAGLTSYLRLHGGCVMASGEVC